MMRIATWNVARPTSRERTRLARLRDAITDIDADVWIFTETHDVLSSSVAAHLCSTRTQDRPCEDGERWVTIASRWPLERLGTSDDARTAAALVHPLDARAFVVFGTVLPWLGSRWRDVEAPTAPRSPPPSPCSARESATRRPSVEVTFAARRRGPARGLDVGRVGVRSRRTGSRSGSRSRP